MKYLSTDQNKSLSVVVDRLGSLNSCTPTTDNQTGFIFKPKVRHFLKD